MSHFHPSPEDDEKRPVEMSHDEKPEGEQIDVTKVADPFGKSRFGKWLENLWYHYKFPIIAAVVLFIVAAICLVQCVTKTKDEDRFNICYVGAYDFLTGESLTEDGAVPTVKAMRQTLSPAIQDILGEEKKTNITIDPIAISQETSTEDRDAVRGKLDAGDGYIFLMSEGVYNTYSYVNTSDGGKDYYMRPVADYLPADHSGYEITSDGRGIYLRSLPLGAAAGFRDLPEDTILCLRIAFSITNFGWDKKQQQKIYSNYEALFRTMLAGDFVPVANE